MDELDDKIAELKVNLADQEKIMPFREEELAEKLQVIADINEEMKNTKDRILKFSETRKQEHEEYLERRDEMVGMVNGL